MNRRDFCRAAAGTLAAGASVAALGPAALAGQAKAAKWDLSPDALAAEAVRVFLPEKRTCGEAMLAAGCKALGIKSEMVPDIALGLGGGVGLQGHVCGLVSSASMVISLAVAVRKSDYATKRNAAWKHAGKFCRDFVARFGTASCRKLSGLDLTTPEGMAALKARVKKDKCAKMVHAAARMLAARLREIDKENG